jgi:SulP family sulfate permease
MVLATVLVQLFQLPVETIGSRFGDIPSSLPAPSLPALSFERVRELMGPAATVALLAGIESLLSAVVTDGMTGHRHRSNMELVAQGAANIVAPLFGGFCATGAIARTATNVRNGATTPVAGIVHALTLLVIMLVFGRWARLVPMCCLASVLVVVAYNMSEWRAFRGLLRAPRGDVVVLLTTFALTVVFDLTLAVQVGVVLAAFLFMRRMAEVTRVGAVNHDMKDTEDEESGTGVALPSLPAGVQLYEVNGPFFFGAADKLRDVLDVVDRAPRVLILRLRHVPVIDATGLHALERLHADCARAGTALILSAVHSQPLHALRRSKYLRRIGKANVTPNLESAVMRARVVLSKPPNHQPPAAPRKKKERRKAA